LEKQQKEQKKAKKPAQATQPTQEKPKKKKGIYHRVSMALRDGRDGGRACYAMARRLFDLPTYTRRQKVAREWADRAGFEITRSAGFRIFQPGRFAEADEVVAESQRLAAAAGDIAARSANKPFMVPILQSAKLPRDSAYLRFASRPDVVAAVARYLGMVPILTSIEVYYSAFRDVALASSQLFHCDQDDTSQIKVYILCTEVDEKNGAMLLLGADTSRIVRRALRYEYRNRATDEEVFDAVGDRDRHLMVGPPGTVAFVDTSRCFHYGSRVREGAPPRLVAVFQYLSPFSFRVSRDRKRAAPYGHAALPTSSDLERLVLGAE
jgi:hypothetical protein